MDVKGYRNSQTFGARIGFIDYKGLKKMSASFVNAVEDAIPNLVQIDNETLAFSVLTKGDKIELLAAKSFIPKLQQETTFWGRIKNGVKVFIGSKTEFRSLEIYKDEIHNPFRIEAIGRELLNRTLNSETAIKFKQAGEKALR